MIFLFLAQMGPSFLGALLHQEQSKTLSMASPGVERAPSKHCPVHQHAGKVTLSCSSPVSLGLEIAPPQMSFHQGLCCAYKV